MIELKNIVSGYGKKKVIKNVSLCIPKGKLLAIIGPNGSGKSTLLKTATGILPAWSGSITVDESDFDGISRLEKAKKVSYLAQVNGTPDMSVFQMVLHGRFPYLSYPRRYTKNDMEIAKRAISQMGLSDLADKPMCSLSGGTRQKAYLAMALTQNTDLVLLDEPTTYLDISAQLEQMRILRSLANVGKGVAVVMHDLELAFRFADEIVVINNGEICAKGTPDDICKMEIIKEIFGVNIVNDGENGYCYRY